MKKRILGLLIGLMLVSWGGLSYALTITPSSYNGNSWTVNTDMWSGNETGVPAIFSSFLSMTGVNLSVMELYKSDSADGDTPQDESGALVLNYDTVFSGVLGDWYGASITHQGTDAVDSTGAIYLLVKDGNANPSWYVFNLTGIWNGTDEIILNDFWYQISGSISHVSIYGDPGTTVVPEPTTMFLFGTGIAGLAGIARRKRS